MPPVLNRLVDAYGKDYDPAVYSCCVPDDDYYAYLYGFPAEAVRRMEPFDCALTSDRFYVPPDHLLIVSRRFRQWCLKKKLPMVGIPWRWSNGGGMAARRVDSRNRIAERA